MKLGIHFSFRGGTLIASNVNDERFLLDIVQE